MRPTVLIADDHLVAESLRILLSPSYEVVGIATNGRELTDLAMQYKPELIIANLSMPVLNSLDAMHDLIGKGSCSKFVVLTTHLERSLAVLAFRAGASAFLSKTMRSDELQQALKVVLAGRCYLGSQFPCDIVSVLAEAARRPASNKALQLTRRQREVLKLVAEGKTMKEVADQLNISTRTAESYKYHLMNALGIHTNAELVQHAIKIGLIIVIPFAV